MRAPTDFHLCVRITPRCRTDPLYAGTTLVLAQLLNYMQLGSEDPPMLLLALALVALGLSFLTLTAAAKEKAPRPEVGLESSLLPPVATTRPGDQCTQVSSWRTATAAARLRSTTPSRAIRITASTCALCKSRSL